MLCKRVIPCLDVDGGRVKKGVRFKELRDAGDPVAVAAAYDAQGADEICFLDISASAEGRATTIDVYTAQPIFGFLEDILKPAGPAAVHGLRWFPSRPPIEGLEFEVDLRGVARELVL